MHSILSTFAIRKLLEQDIPNIVKALSGIHEELKRSNDLKEVLHDEDENKTISS